MSANVFPKPLNAFSTGDKKADEAIAKLQTWVLSPASPAATPGGDEYDATTKAASKVAPDKLLALLDDAACDTGHCHWDDKAIAKLGTADKRAFNKHYEAVSLAQKTREGYLAWLMNAVLPTGLTRVIAIAGSPKIKPKARVVAANVLFSQTDRKALRAIADGLDPHKWDGKDGAQQQRMLWRVYRTGAYALGRIDKNTAFEHLSGLFAATAIKSPAGKARAEATLSALLHNEEIDRRWLAVLLPWLKTSLDISILMALKQAPPDPIVVEPICAYLGKSQEKISYFNESALEILARSADARAVPYLKAALLQSWTNYPHAFEGFKNAGDPTMAPVIRAWLKENGDGPKGERTKLGESIARQLEARAKKAGTALVPFAPPPKPEPKRERPVLKFEKCKPMKLPKLETLHKLHSETFAKAKLSACFDKIVQRAVWLVPTRVDEASLKVGVTKLGGHPDLDDKTEWPRFKGEPLAFVAQIRLEEMAPHLPKGLVPSAGLLSFFVGNDPTSERAGYLEQARVLFIGPKAKLTRREVPEDFTDQIFQACQIKPIATLSLPSPSNQHVTKTMKRDEVERYAEDFADTPALPQFLGYRDHGYDAEEPATAELLLQLTGDSQSDMQFGDCDYLSFFIDRAKLRAGDFSKVWPHIGD